MTKPIYEFYCLACNNPDRLKCVKNAYYCPRCKRYFSRSKLIEAEVKADLDFLSDLYSEGPPDADMPPGWHD
jgi:hypothetical protein